MLVSREEGVLLKEEKEKEIKSKGNFYFIPNEITFEKRLDEIEGLFGGVVYSNRTFTIGFKSHEVFKCASDDVQHLYVKLIQELMDVISNEQDVKKKLLCWRIRPRVKKVRYSSEEDEFDDDEPDCVIRYRYHGYMRWSILSKEDFE